MYIYMSVHHHINMLPVPDTQYCKCCSLVLIFMTYSPQNPAESPSLAPTHHAVARRSIRDASGGTCRAKRQQRRPRDGTRAGTGTAANPRTAGKCVLEGASDGREQRPRERKPGVSRLGKSFPRAPLFREVCPVPSKGKRRATNTPVPQRGAARSCFHFLVD